MNETPEEPAVEESDTTSTPPAEEEGERYDGGEVPDNSTSDEE